MQALNSVADVEKFLLEHGEQVVDVLGAEVDRIELEIKVRKSRDSIWGWGGGDQILIIALGVTSNTHHTPIQLSGMFTFFAPPHPSNSWLVNVFLLQKQSPEVRHVDLEIL